MDRVVNTGEWVRKWARVRPHKTAVVDDDRPCTYGELDDRINRLIRFFLTRGIAEGDRVATLLYNCRHYLEIFFALSRIGAILVPLNWRLSVPELLFIVGDSDSKALIFDPEFLEAVEALRARTRVRTWILCGDAGGPEASVPSWASGYEASIAGLAGGRPHLEASAGDGDPHIIMYTSGTTGLPKGAVLSHRKTFFNVLNSEMIFDLRTDDVALVVRPLFHSGGLIVDSLPLLYKGGTVVLRRRRFSPPEILESVGRYRVTILELPATVYQFILNELNPAEYDLRSLRCCFTGGERVPVHLLKALMEKGIVVSQVYGLTEASTLLWLPMEKAREKVGSVGKPVLHGDVRIVNRYGRQVRPGESGEIIVRGPIVMNGYWNRPEETVNAIKDGWLHTGDLAQIDSEGFAFIVDRKKDMFISGGENVYPAEVEKVLLDHPKVAEAAVIGVDDAKWGEVGKAFLVLRQGVNAGSEEIIDFLRGRLAGYKVPRYVTFVPRLPKTASGKIRKYLLKTRKER